MKSLIALLIVVLSPFAAAGKEPSLHFKANIDDSQEIFFLSSQRISPIPISKKRLLVITGEKLTMLDENKKMLWEWGEAEFMSAPPIIDPQGNIYGIADDGFSFALTKDGKRKWMRRMNGRANYSQILRYGDDQYLMLVNMRGYCEEDVKCPNSLEAYQFTQRNKEQALWSMEFPPEAKVAVWGKRILAVTYKKDSLDITEIVPPKKKR